MVHIIFSNIDKPDVADVATITDNGALMTSVDLARALVPATVSGALARSHSYVMMPPRFDVAADTAKARANELFAMESHLTAAANVVRAERIKLDAIVNKES